MGTSYDVWVNLNIGGNTAAALASVTAGTKALGATASHVGNQVGNAGHAAASGWHKVEAALHKVSHHAHELVKPLESAVEYGMHFAASMAKVGVAAAIAATTYGVMHLNSELESTNISLAAVFKAQGFASDFNQGLTLAADTVAKMKQDVKTLPGDLGQLSGIFKMIATPAAQGGATIDQIRKMSGTAMIVGGVMGLDMAQTARETAMLLSGRAGSHNVLGARLGFIGERAHALHGMTYEQRFKEVTKEFSKYQDAMDAFGHSWTGITTTLKDNIKYVLLGPTTSPLFESVKKTIEGINHWFDANTLKVKTFTDAMGSKLAYAWDWGIRKVEEWGPLVLDFADRAYDRITSIWEAIEPTVNRISEAAKSFLKDDQAFDKIIHILELYAGMKVAGAAGGMAMNVLGVAGGIGSLLSAGKAMGWIGAGSGVTAATGQAAWASTMAGNFLGTGAAEGAALSGSGAAAGIGVAGAGAIAAAVATWMAAGYEAYGLFSDIKHDKQAEGVAWRGYGEKLVDDMHEMNYANTEYQRVLHALIASGDELNANMLMAAAAAKDYATAAPGSGHAGMQRDWDQRMTDYYFQASGSVAGMTRDLINGWDSKQKKAREDALGGRGAVHINQVQISVTTNQEPSRVALAVGDIFTGWRRNRRSSPDVTNWSTANPTS